MFSHFLSYQFTIFNHVQLISRDLLLDHDSYLFKKWFLNTVCKKQINDGSQIRYFNPVIRTHSYAQSRPVRWFFSPSVRDLDFGIREVFAYLLGESAIRNSGVWNPKTTQGIKNPTNDWNPGSMFHCQSESHVGVNAFSSANSGCKEMFSLAFFKKQCHPLN